MAEKLDNGEYVANASFVFDSGDLKFVVIDTSNNYYFISSADEGCGASLVATDSCAKFYADAACTDEISYAPEYATVYVKAAAVSTTLELATAGDGTLTEITAPAANVYAVYELTLNDYALSRSRLITKILT